MSRLAIVTGSDSGIGRATAVRLATEDCDAGTGIRLRCSRSVTSVHEQASYTTGASFVIDGGMLVMAAVANRLAI